MVDLPFPPSSHPSLSVPYANAFLPPLLYHRRFLRHGTAEGAGSSSPHPPLLDSISDSPPEPITIGAVSLMLFQSFALSATKKSGQSEWSLRVNPSSGNLHPTEVYVFLPTGPAGPTSPTVSTGPAEPLQGARLTSPQARWGVFHYSPKEHVLEQRVTLAASSSDHLFVQSLPARPARPRTPIAPLQSSPHTSDTTPPSTTASPRPPTHTLGTAGISSGGQQLQSFYVALSSIYWRESWKYVE